MNNNDTIATLEMQEQQIEGESIGLQVFFQNKAEKFTIFFDDSIYFQDLNSAKHNNRSIIHLWKDLTSTPLEEIEIKDIFLAFKNSKGEIKEPFLRAHGEVLQAKLNLI